MQSYPLSHKKTINNATASGWEKCLNRLKGAYAESTVKAYHTDSLHFVDWCETINEIPFPSTPELIGKFISLESTYYSTSTIKRRLAAIGKMHQLLKLKNPIQDEEVTLALRRAFRGKLSRPKKALGLTKQLRDRLISACKNDTLYDKRDKALISVGYDTLSRRSELSAILYEDITFTQKGAKIIIRRAKNDQFGYGRVSHLSDKSALVLKEWIRASRINSGPVFRSIKHDVIHTEAIHPNTINRIIKRTAEKAGMTPDQIQCLSGHSMRIGAAQDMMVAGLDILPIMAAGGWKTTNVVARYIENADISPILRKFLN